MLGVQVLVDFLEGVENILLEPLYFLNNVSSLISHLHLRSQHQELLLAQHREEGLSSVSYKLLGHHRPLLQHGLIIAVFLCIGVIGTAGEDGLVVAGDLV